jgi:hypothetical protein
MDILIPIIFLSSIVLLSISAIFMVEKDEIKN